MSDRPVGVLLEDMLERIDRIARYTQGFDRDAFVEDDKTIDAALCGQCMGTTVMRSGYRSGCLLPADLARAPRTARWTHWTAGPRAEDAGGRSSPP
jgi:hypothetical protein